MEKNKRGEARRGKIEARDLRRWVERPVDQTRTLSSGEGRAISKQPASKEGNLVNGRLDEIGAQMKIPQY